MINFLQSAPVAYFSAGVYALVFLAAVSLIWRRSAQVQLLKWVEDETTYECAG